jgi:hypothetical protein
MATRDASGETDLAPVTSPGDGLLHPIALGAIALLVLNDQVLKRVAPGLVTGKLSDVAGLVFFPLFLVALVEVGQSLLGNWRGPSHRVLIGACVATGIVFTLVKTTPLGEQVYEQGLGLLQWPFAALDAVLAGQALPTAYAVQSTQDATDLMTLPAVGVAYLVGRRRVN